MNEDYNYFQGKDFRKSLAAYEHMVATGEPAEFDSETLTDIAEYYAMNQRMDDADRCIQYALSFYPDSVDPQIFLSRQQMFFGHRAEAWRICNAITDQDDREVIFLRAELHFYFNESQKAFDLLLQEYQKADDEEAPDFLYDSIALCKDYGFGDKAMEWVQLLRKDFPDYNEAIALQAEIHNYRREYDKAISLLEANIQQVPFDTQAWLQMAEAYLWLERYEEATEATEYALAIEPENAEGILMMANILLDSNHLDEAHEYYSRFLKSFPNDERANYLDAQCLIDAGQHEAAIQRLERLAQTSYTIRGYVLSYLAFCHAQLGHDEQSLHYRQQAEKEEFNNLSSLFPDLYPGPDLTINPDDLPF